jgi:hypothetical protein
MMEQVMTKAVWGGILTAAAVLLFSTQAYAQAVTTAPLTVNATVSAKAKLTLGAVSVSFADADPDVTPLLSATAVTVDVKARTTAAGNVTLTVLADGDLTNATSDTIGIANLTWTATGTSFAAGTMATTAVSVGSWTGGGTQAGTQTYKLVNSWNYKTGAYTAAITYTLTAP